MSNTECCLQGSSKGESETLSAGLQGKLRGCQLDCGRFLAASKEPLPARWATFPKGEGTIFDNLHSLENLIWIESYPLWLSLLLWRSCRNATDEVPLIVTAPTVISKKASVLFVSLCLYSRQTGMP